MGALVVEVSEPSYLARDSAHSPAVYDEQVRLLLHALVNHAQGEVYQHAHVIGLGHPELIASAFEEDLVLRGDPYVQSAKSFCHRVPFR